MRGSIIRVILGDTRSEAVAHTKKPLISFFWGRKGLVPFVTTRSVLMDRLPLRHCAAHRS